MTKVLHLLNVLHKVQNNITANMCFRCTLPVEMCRTVQPANIAAFQKVDVDYKINPDSRGKYATYETSRIPCAQLQNLIPTLLCIEIVKENRSTALLNEALRKQDVTSINSLATEPFAVLIMHHRIMHRNAYLMSHKPITYKHIRYKNVNISHTNCVFLFNYVYVPLYN